MMAGTPFLGFDFDSVLRPDGTPEPIVPKILDALGNPYTEVTPSGEGLRAFVNFKGKLPGSRRKFLEERGGKKYGAELYGGADPGRYFTVTGKKFLGDGIPAPRDVELAYLLCGNILDEKFKSLFLGDIAGYGNDDSRADFALCSMLAKKVGPNAMLTDHFFRVSGLMREKWDSRRGNSTYGQQTIVRALGPATPATSRAPNVSKSDDSAPRKQEPSPFKRDILNAHKFAGQHKGNLIYIADRGVRCAWDGRVWRLNDVGAWHRAGIATVRSMYREAEAALDQGLREMLAKHALRSENRIERMLQSCPVRPPHRANKVFRDIR